MILSNANEKIVWELNELLAADRRAKAFSEASVSGEYSERGGGFEEAHWHQLGDNSDADELESAAPDSADAVVEDEVDATADEAEVEQEVDIDQLLESRYQEGVAEGIRQSNLENQQREALAERFSAAIGSEMEALPRVWPVVTDLSLDIAKTVCLQSLRLNENAFRQYLTMALKEMEFPESVPVEIKVSAAMAELVSLDQLTKLLSDRPVSLSVDANLSDGDITIQYDNVTIDRLLEREFAQLREQLVAQFPDQLSEP
jgi:flagellar biosynthesis/type III secretory pathway protein FliH